MKTFIKKILTQSGIWYHIQFSNWYREFKRPGYRKKLKKLEAFYLSLFPKGSPRLIFDIGANIGDYSYVFSRIAAKTVIVEPDATNNQILTARFGSRKGCTVLKKAVSSSIGTAEFFMEAEGSTLNTLSNKWVEVLENEDKTRFSGSHQFRKKVVVETTTLDALIAEFGLPDYIKIDVEGFEKEVVEGLHQAIPLISFECNLPEFTEETVWIVAALDRLHSGTTFNFIRDDAFVLPGPVSAREITDIIRSEKYRFMEIYCMHS